MWHQAQQKDKHDMHAQYWDLHIGQKVMVKNMQPGSTWIPSEVAQKLEHVTYLVGRPWKCHIEQLKERSDALAAVPLDSVPHQVAEDDALGEGQRHWAWRVCRTEV